MTSCCAFCGRPAVERHHLTGRDDSGRYLSPTTVPCCRPCNILDFRLWRLTGIDRGGDRLPVLLRRTAVYFARLGRDDLRRALVEAAAEIDQVAS